MSNKTNGLTFKKAAKFNLLLSRSCEYAVSWVTTDVSGALIFRA